MANEIEWYEQQLKAALAEAHAAKNIAVEFLQQEVVRMRAENDKLRGDLRELSGDNAKARVAAATEVLEKMVPIAMQYLSHSPATPSANADAGVTGSTSASAPTHPITAIAVLDWLSEYHDGQWFVSGGGTKVWDFSKLTEIRESEDGYTVTTDDDLNSFFLANEYLNTATAADVEIGTVIRWTQGLGVSQLLFRRAP